MKKTKMSLANVQGKLSKSEMKKIMAGSGNQCPGVCLSGDECHITTSCNTCINYSCYKF
jgi:hypothetical protein